MKTLVLDVEISESGLNEIRAEPCNLPAEGLHLVTEATELRVGGSAVESQLCILHRDGGTYDAKTAAAAATGANTGEKIEKNPIALEDCEIVSGTL